jgi:spore germination cell wall hydrolase CwlJ-like protein
VKGTIILFSLLQTRDSARALVGAAVTGSAMGLILAGAYLGGGLASARSQETQAAVSQQTQTVIAMPAAKPSVADSMRKQGARSGDILKASLSGPAAAPFKASSTRDLDCLTEAVYYEARGEGAAGQKAVAQVILNRVRHPAFPKSVCAVVYQGCQFSFSCNGAMRGRRDAGAWNRARGIATDALSGAVMAGVGNATHFHTVNVSPNWGPSLMRVGQVGLHIFYRFSGRNGRPGAFKGVTVASSQDNGSEPGKFEYARLSPSDAASLTSGPALSVDLSAPGVGGPAGPVSEPASAPVQAAPAAEAVAQPAATEVKVSAPATASKPTSATAS